MNPDDHIEIPLSKKKMTLLLIGCIVFVLLGLWMVIARPSGSGFLFGNPVISLIVGMVAVLFFGMIGVSIFRKFSEKKPGLVINREGIADHSSGVSAGLIPWSDIEDVRVSQVMNQKFLMIIVSNPESYFEKVSNPIKRNAMKMNYKSYGSPISISAGALKTDFASLERLLIEKMDQFKS